MLGLLTKTTVLGLEIKTEGSQCSVSITKYQDTLSKNVSRYMDILLDIDYAKEKGL